ncbi:MAG: 1-acyl-sn-glycerol-3-phosphate acyltransferase [Bacteroidia bacterium]|nr:1-acyl-sn-glycerol-3-phosphate acyltransferase [Bacteroidia bacterium]
MKKILGKIGFVWFGLVFAVLFLVLYPFFVLTLSTEKLYPVANFLRKIWAWGIFILTGSIAIVKREQPNFPSPCIIVSNHTSYLDIVVLGLFAPPKISFMGKVELAKIPLFGIFFRTVDIAVHRESLRGSHKAILDAANRIDKGYCINIYPEGTIWNRTPLLKPFKNGAFKLAIEKKVPIIPITFYNNFKALPDEKFEYYPTVIKCKVHRAIETSHLNIEDSDQLRDDIYNLIHQELIDKHIIHENN